MKAIFNAKRLQDFNNASGTNYNGYIHFVTIRKTLKGLKVGFTLGKPHEIDKLRFDVAKAGKPYYCNF